MSKKTELLKTNHTAQIQWLRNQVAKNNNSIFLNPTLGNKAWKELLSENMGQIDDQELEKFVARYLSESGIKKLHITLKVAETRAKKKGFRLQCNIDYSSNNKLEKLVTETGMTKGELISKLIDLAEIKTKTIAISEEKSEKQLHCNDLEVEGANNYKAEEEQLELEALKPIETELDIPEANWRMYTKFSQIKPGTIMRSKDSKTQQYTVTELDCGIIRFTDGGELDAYQAKNRYEFVSS